MATLDLDDLNALSTAATPGPWRADVADRGDCVLWGPDGEFLANAQAAPHWTPAADGGERAVLFDVDRRDMQFVAAARQAVPAMSAAIARVLEMHAVRDGVCPICGTPDGCETVRALRLDIDVADTSVAANAPCVESISIRCDDFTVDIEPASTTLGTRAWVRGPEAESVFYADTSEGDQEFEFEGNSEAHKGEIFAALMRVRRSGLLERETALDLSTVTHWLIG